MAASEGLRCRKCGSRDTLLAPADALSKHTGDSAFLRRSSGTASAATSGALAAIDPMVFVELIKAFFEWLGLREQTKLEQAQQNRKILYCKNCGHWENT
jgi:DNA-directed RNA polymerase subunit RPC12/RpoP